MLIGNLILTSLIKETGSLKTSIEYLSKLMDVKHKVLPLSEDYLTLMGETVDGEIIEGEEQITKSNKKYKKLFYKDEPHRIEAGTFLCATAVTNGLITLNNVFPKHLEPVLNKLEECGCKYKLDKNKILLESPKKLKAIDIKTMPYPGFPTDMQSVFTAILCTAKGTSIIVENIFENRYKYINELKRMGAKVNIERRIFIRLTKSKIWWSSNEGYGKAKGF